MLGMGVGETAKLTLPFYYRGWAGPGLIVEAKIFWRFAPAIALSPFRSSALAIGHAVSALMRRTISRTAFSKPTKSARETME